MSPDLLGRHDSWTGVRAVVVGFGPAGFAAADNLNHLGADVVALDDVAETGPVAEKAELLRVLGAEIRLEPGALDESPAQWWDGVDLVVTTGIETPLVEQARRHGVTVWGDVELAWRLRDPAHRTPWLCVTGASGAAETVGMLDSILRAAGLRSIVVGDAGLPVVEVVMDPEPYDVLAVELSAAQLRHTDSMSAESAVVLNTDGYADDLGRIYERVQRACVYNLADPETERLVREADVEEGARAIGFTLGLPSVGTVGGVEDLLADRAFIEERATSAAELGTLDDLASTDPSYVAHALAAAALARAHGVSQAAVRDGLRSLRPE